jgi:hypothetical protein
MKGGAKVIIEKHRLEGIFIAKGKEEALVTRNLTPGESVYGEKRIQVEVSCTETYCCDLLQKCTHLLSRVKKEKLNTGFGILFARRLVPQFLVVLKTFTLNLERKCCILVLLQEQPFHMFRMLSVR